MHINVFAEARRVQAEFLRPGEYAITTGSVLSALGIRHTKALDILAVPRVLHHAQVRGGTTKTFGTSSKIVLGKVEFYSDLHCGDYQPNIEDVLARARLHNGFHFVALEDILDFKRAALKTFGNPKSRRDVAAIERYMVRENETPGVG